MKRKTRKLLKNHSFSRLFLVPAVVVIVGLAACMFFVFKKPIATCANSISCTHDLSGDFQTGKQSIFLGRAAAVPSYLSNTKEVRRVLGQSTGDKHIFVDLARQQLEAFEDKHLVMSFPVATGKWGRTPTGDFHIWIKLKFTHMEGGEGADYYNLYNVPYTMFFYNDEVAKSAGFSLHGAYWHNNFGHPMSHGCVNIRPEDAKKLYNWADPQTIDFTTYATDKDPGTVVTIFGTPPEE